MKVNIEAKIKLFKIVEHPFMNNGMSIPEGLPNSIRACPPSVQFIRSHQLKNPTRGLGSTFNPTSNPNFDSGFNSKTNFHPQQTSEFAKGMRSHQMKA